MLHSKYIHHCRKPTDVCDGVKCGSFVVLDFESQENKTVSILNEVLLMSKCGKMSIFTTWNQLITVDSRELNKMNKWIQNMSPCSINSSFPFTIKPLKIFQAILFYQPYTELIILFFAPYLFKKKKKSQKSNARKWAYQHFVLWGCQRTNNEAEKLPVLVNDPQNAEAFVHGHKSVFKLLNMFPKSTS